ncbi:MAG: hypothetical protein JWO67_4692 [Streptosporangiaceae bacterium]|nr:hypothetical protein [Streptosporangiaceae bacterium]
MTPLSAALLLRNSIGAHSDDDARELRRRAVACGATVADVATALAERDAYLAESVTVWTDAS